MGQPTLRLLSLSSIDATSPSFPVIVLHLSRVCGLALLAGVSVNGFAGTERIAPEKPQILPEMRVSAGVPLVKVAEYQMRESRSGPAAVAYQGMIYIIGGFIGSGKAADSIERFDPQTGHSEIVGHLRLARFWHRAVVVGDKIYVIGGATPGGLRPGYFEALENSAMANRRSKSIVLPPSAEGGTDAEASVEIFDPATGRIARGPEMIEPRHSFVCVESGGQIFAIGGQHVLRNKIRFTNTTEILDVAKNQWRQGVPMPTVRATDGAVVEGGFIVVPGGYNGLFATDAVDVFDLRAGTWRTIGPLCHSTSAHSVAFLGKYLFLFGDYDSPERLMAYNLKTRESERFTLGYTPARHSVAVTAADRIYVIGGRVSRETESIKAIQVFELAKPSKPQT